MTLDEAIEHCDEIIEKEDCSKCAKEHEKLKKWLEELKELKNPQPYKFEDLKAGMWIWDNQIKGVIQVKKILTKKYCKYLYHDKNKKVFIDEFGAIEFEENRFYPVIIGGEG